MRIILTILLCCFSFASYSQTQYEMNMDALHAYHKADSELNWVYKRILTMYKGDTLFIKNLKKSQKLWVQFRDAEMDMKFPDYNPYWYGTIQPMCASYYAAELTTNRTKRLKEWIDGIDEQDGCKGSALSKYLIENPNEQKEYFDDFKESFQKRNSK